MSHADSLLGPHIPSQTQLRGWFSHLTVEWGCVLGLPWSDFPKRWSPRVVRSWNSHMLNYFCSREIVARWEGTVKTTFDPLNKTRKARMIWPNERKQTADEGVSSICCVLSANTKKKDVVPSCSHTQIQSTTPYLLPNRETLTWQELGFFFFKLNVKQEDEVDRGLVRAENTGNRPLPCHRWYTTVHGERGWGEVFYLNLMAGTSIFTV